MTRYCYDTEFLEDGSTINLISIGIVCENGREYYAVNLDADWDRIKTDNWLCRNVVPSLPLLNNRIQPPSFGSKYGHTFHLNDRSVLVKSRRQIRNEVREFLIGHLTPIAEHDGKPVYSEFELPELWADYSAYDHVALCQLFGKMISLPTGIPMYTNDLQQALHATSAARAYSKPEQEKGEHNALEDARHNMTVLKGLIAAGGVE